MLDGAHNPVGMEMLKKALEKDLDYEKMILVIGILKDKDIQRMLSTIVPVSDIIITTKSTNPRACEIDKLKDMIVELGFEKEMFIENTISKAIEHARSLASKNDMICISGSLFTVGEARSYLLIISSKEIVKF